jgi:spermidine/putrescine transport system ATP-binding protein
VATPREIYTAPVNRFVASFIGETNFLPVTPAPGGVRLGSGHVLAAEGSGGILTIRPEQVRLVAAEGAPFTGTVDSLVYFGTDMHCHVRLGDGESLTLRLPLSPGGEAGVGPGDRVGIAFEPGAARLIEA